MKTLLYGGTFNPVHIGHIRLAQNAKALLCPERMFLVPSFVPPHKQTEYLAPAEDRLTMAHLAAMEIGCSVSDTELRRKDCSYTVDTLSAFSEEGYGDLYFLMGTDMFLTLEKWHEPQRLLSLCTPVVAARGENERESLLCQAKTIEERFGRKSIVCDFPVTEVSSTALRELLARGEDVSRFLTPEIAAYLRSRKLYTTKG